MGIYVGSGQHVIRGDFAAPHQQTSVVEHLGGPLSIHGSGNVVVTGEPISSLSLRGDALNVVVVPRVHDAWVVGGAQLQAKKVGSLHVGAGSSAIVDQANAVSVSGPGSKARITTQDGLKPVDTLMVAGGHAETHGVVNRATVQEGGTYSAYASEPPPGEDPYFWMGGPGNVTVTGAVSEATVHGSPHPDYNVSDGGALRFKGSPEGSDPVLAGPGETVHWTR